VLYLFFKLRRTHVHMAPYDVSKECKEVCMELDCDRMCREVLERPCPEEECGCAPKGEWPHKGCHHCDKLDGPWLMSPEAYRHALDCAYDRYHKAKDDLAKAEAELSARDRSTKAGRISTVASGLVVTKIGTGKGATPSAEATT